MNLTLEFLGEKIDNFERKIEIFEVKILILNKNLGYLNLTLGFLNEKRSFRTKIRDFQRIFERKIDRSCKRATLTRNFTSPEESPKIPQ